MISKTKSSINIFTFDTEEWFHTLDNKSIKTEKEYNNFSLIIYKSVDNILNMLEKKYQKDIFFV